MAYIARVEFLMQFNKHYSKHSEGQFVIIITRQCLFTSHFVCDMDYYKFNQMISSIVEKTK